MGLKLEPMHSGAVTCDIQIKEYERLWKDSRMSKDMELAFDFMDRGSLVFAR
jgi:hypothetical protein